MIKHCSNCGNLEIIEVLIEKDDEISNFCIRCAGKIFGMSNTNNKISNSSGTEVPSYTGRPKENSWMN
jgi:hypothetical protein